MIGNSPMGSTSSPELDFSLSKICRSWYLFRRGKKCSPELFRFQYNLESNLSSLQEELENNSYHPGGYRTFIVNENKKRTISVASIRDRVVHRLLYEYLVPIYDKTFIYDVWSCRREKGLLGAIERTEWFLNKYQNSFVWRADIKKFFDNVDHEILLKILSFRITDKKTFNLLREVIGSYGLPTATERE